jgi:hypothetical protein
VEEKVAIAAWNRNPSEPDPAGGAVLARLEWFDRPEFAPAVDRPDRLELRHARLDRGRPARRLRLGGRRLARRTVKAAVVVGASAAVVAGVSSLRERSDDAAPHDPVTLGLHRSTPAHHARRRPAHHPRLHSKPKPRPAAHRPAKAAPTPTPKANPKRAGSGAPISLPTFTWTASPGASGYEFQLFRGPSLVYVSRTPTPSITLPSSWTFKGRLVRVTPGAYRWYVWPLTGGTRGDTAVVQAKLTVG